MSSADGDEYEFRNPATPLTDEQRFFRRETLAEIEANPELFDMYDWSRTRKTADGCRTTRCVAGWAQFLRRGRVYPDGGLTADLRRVPPADEDAVLLMGLTEDEFYNGSRVNQGLWFTHESDALDRLRKLAAA